LAFCHEAFQNCFLSIADQKKLKVKNKNKIKKLKVTLPTSPFFFLQLISHWCDDQE
jgi:hypothetical protein